MINHPLKPTQAETKNIIDFRMKRRLRIWILGRAEINRGLFCVGNEYLFRSLCKSVKSNLEVVSAAFGFCGKHTVQTLDQILCHRLMAA